MKKLKYNIGDMLIETSVNGTFQQHRQTIVLDIDNRNRRNNHFCGRNDWCYKVLNVKTGEIYRQSYVYIETFCKKVG